MFLLDTMKPGEAQGAVAEAYAAFPPAVGIPRPLELLSASPGLMALQADSIRYYGKHPHLSFPLLAAIRYIAAVKSGHAFCETFNGGILTKMGAPKESLAHLASEQESVLEPREAAMLGFVAKALEAPAAVTKEDIAGLRERGYTDADIIDAVAHGARMVGSAIIYNAFTRD